MANACVKPEVAVERLIALQQSTDPLNQGDYDSRANYLSAIVNVAKLKDGKSTEASWRRKSHSKPESKSYEETGNYSNDRRTPAMVQCPGKHILSRFQTPSPTYSCDICCTGQSIGTWMHGCRQCNWDACVPCYNRVLARIREAMAIEEAKVAKMTPQKPEVEFPPQTLQSINACLDIFRDDAEAMESVFHVVKVLAKDPDYRKTELRYGIALAVDRHIKYPNTCCMGFAALENLCSQVEDIRLEEAQALLSLSTKALKEYLDRDHLVVSHVYGVLLNLYDTSPDARKLILDETGDIPSLLERLTSTIGSAELIERYCAMLSRVLVHKAGISNLDEEGILSTLEMIVKEYYNDNDVCEQAFAVAIALTRNHAEDDFKVNLVSRLARARFQGTML